MNPQHAEHSGKPASDPLDLLRFSLASLETVTLLPHPSDLVIERANLLIAADGLGFGGLVSPDLVERLLYR